jgi:hypothetical protein
MLQLQILPVLTWNPGTPLSTPLGITISTTHKPFRVFHVFGLDHKRMSDVCERCLIRTKSTTENQYVSLRSSVIQCQGWKVEQISFITGARSVDIQDLIKNLKFFRVPEPSISSIYSKLSMRTFDVYANILKCMYNTRFSGGAPRSEVSADAQPTPSVVTSFPHTIVTLPNQIILNDGRRVLR